MARALPDRVRIDKTNASFIDAPIVMASRLLGTLEEPAVNRFPDDVSLDRFHHVDPRFERIGGRLDIEHCIQRVELEHVVVFGTGGAGGAAGCCAAIGIAVSRAIVDTTNHVSGRIRLLLLPLRVVRCVAYYRRASGTMVSPRASIATRDAIFLARPAGVFMLLVRNASENRFRRPRVANVLRARGFASIAARRSSGMVAAVALRM